MRPPTPSCPAAPAAAAAGDDRRCGTARLWLDAERLERTALLLGCDPALGIVAGHMARLARGRDPARLSWLEAGSAAALGAVAEGTAHLAGLHLRDGETGEFNVPQATRALAATGGVVFAFSRWEQGFVVAPGNPKGVRTAADLVREDVRLVNREPGAGSRALLDQMLVGAGVPQSAVRGYDRQVASHFQVAGTVAAGAADAGIALAGRAPRPTDWTSFPWWTCASTWPSPPTTCATRRWRSFWRPCRPGRCGRSCAPSPATTWTRWAACGRRWPPPDPRGRAGDGARPTGTARPEQRDRNSETATA